MSSPGHSHDPELCLYQLHGVQTEGENGSEKAESPASGSPTTSSSPQRPHDGIGNSFIAMQSFFA